MTDESELGSYNKAIRSPRTAADWLTKDEDIVDFYVGEPLCQFVFTVNGYRNLFRGLKDVTLKLYPGDRHELLNELDKETVDHDLLQWMEARM